MSEQLEIGGAPKPAKTLTCGDLLDMLKVRYKEPEHIHLHEMQIGKGNRRADLVTVSLWQSRGQFVRVFELKVNRSDWLRELKDPAKADPLVNSCHEFIVVAPQGVIHDGEVPPVWGWIEAKGQRLYTRQKPLHRDLEFTPELACRLLLRAQTLLMDAQREARIGYIPVAEIEEEVERKAASKARDSQWLRRDLEGHRDKERDFMERFGFTISDALGAAETDKGTFILQSVRASAKRMRGKAEKLDDIADRLESALGESP